MPIIMNRKKILFLAHSQSIHIKRWVGFFVQAGWDVHICSFHPETIPGTSHYFLNIGEINTTGNNYRYFLKLPRIIYLIYKIKPDIVNSHFLSSFGLLAFLSFYKKHIINLQGTDILINARRNLFRRRLYKKILDSSLHIFSVSEKMTEVLLSDFNQEQSKITTIQYGVNMDIFKNTIRWEEREYDFITNRSFIENSNYKPLLSIFGEIKKIFPHIKIRIAGRGQLKEKILQWIKENNLLENVVFSGVVSENEMADLLNSSRFYFSVTESDGTPLSLFEAAACGCYPILSKNESNLEWTKKGLNAALIDINKTDDVIFIITGLMSKKISEKAVKNNLSFILEKMNYEKNMAKIEKLFHNFFK